MSTNALTSASNARVGYVNNPTDNHRKGVQPSPPLRRASTVNVVYRATLQAVEEVNPIFLKRTIQRSVSLPALSGPGFEKAQGAICVSLPNLRSLLGSFDNIVEKRQEQLASIATSLESVNESESE